jgi:hypothetical protein
MISYSAKAAKAIGFLKSGFNDIEIYVEDPTKVRVWLALVRAHVRPGTRLQSVTQLGSREKVLAACRADQAVDGRPRLYIIDGDFDYVLGRRLPALRHVCRIDSYSLEGIVASRRVVRRLLATYAPELDTEAVENEYAAYIEKIWGPSLRRLFYVYALNHEVDASAKTSGYHVVRLMGGARPRLPDREQTRLRIRAVFEHVKRKNLSATLRVSKAWQRAREGGLAKVVSGKTYLLPLTSEWLSARARVNLTDDQLLLAAVATGTCLDKSLGRKLAEQQALAA